MHADAAVAIKRVFTPILFVRSSIKPMAKAGSAQAVSCKSSKPRSVDENKKVNKALHIKVRKIPMPPILGTAFV